ncbi:MAG: oligosaccharide flippase family protein [Anaeromyxobacter sp.]
MNSERLVLRNAGWLVGAQVLATPLAIAVNAVLARRLGAGEFGWIYLASSLAGLAFLVVEAGQATALPGLVAREKARVGELLGSALAWRGAGAALAVALLAGGAVALDAPPGLTLTLALVALAQGLGSLARAGLDAARGLERADLAAAGHVGGQLLTALLVVPTLLLGGGLAAALGAQLAAAALGLAAVLAALRPLGLPRLSTARTALAALATGGAPFLLLGLATTLQPNVDALVLTRLAPAEVLGWHGAALKLVGALVFPASSLISALYPTLFRLHAEDPEAYRRTAAAALRTATVLVVPVALGCGLFPALGIAIFGEGGFGPAAANLRVLAVHVFLLYFSMTLGCALSAAGRQRAWALAQLGCVAAAFGLDLVLVPWFQAHGGNGGVGVAVSLVTCEVAMLGVAVALVPRGVLDRSVALALARAGVAGAAMAGVAVGLERVAPGWPLLLSAALAGAAYVLVLLGLGGLDPDARAALLRALRRTRK